jgi:NTE family protein
MISKKKTVSLVLGSGGARGLIHIGIIRWLEENDYEIQSISGSSTGALVGGVYAAGKLDEIEEWVSAITKFDILSLMDFSFSIDGFIRGDKLINTLKELIGERMIEDLPIKFTAVATDLEREKEVWISKGPLFDGIRASISLPFLFTPFNYHGKTLIDGGVLNPVPISPTLHDMTDLTIAVNLNGPREKGSRELLMKIEKETVSSSLRNKIKGFISNFTPSIDPKDDKTWGMYYVAYQSLDLMQGAVARQKIAAYPPDVVINIPRNTCRTLEFHKAKELIALGYKKAEELLVDI